MAAKSKVEISSNSVEQRAKNIDESEHFAFRIIDIFVVVLSIGSFLVDTSTDLVLVVSYFHYGHVYWAVATLLLIIIPAVVVQMFSMRWHIADGKVNFSHWVVHILLLGILHRQVLVLKTGLEARSSGDPAHFQRLYHQQNDICMLHLIESFLESAPQLVLQLYIMVSLEDWRSLTVPCFATRERTQMMFPHHPAKASPPRQPLARKPVRKKKHNRNDTRKQLTTRNWRWDS